MYSSVKLVVGEKSLHLRELVVQQKTKNYRRNSRNNNYISKKSTNMYNPRYSAHHSTNTFKNYDYNARGYDYVKRNSSIFQHSKGVVTKALQKCIEDLCSSSEVNFISFMYKILYLLHLNYIFGYFIGFREHLLWL